MKLLDKVRVIVYRMHEKGLEVFLFDTGLAEDEKAWRFPLTTTEIDEESRTTIDLEPVCGADGRQHDAVAIEGDWHDIPSIRAMIKHDMDNISYKIKEVGAELGEGKFVILKDALQRVMPEEYALLKELKEVITEKNVVTNI